jgi:type III restriction enzyme
LRRCRGFRILTQKFGFSIDYTDNAGNLRYYEPDFVFLSDTGEYWVVETKGREDIDVKFKDRTARLWCENASRLTGKSWLYVKVPQEGFDRLQPTHITDLLVFMPMDGGGLWG